MLLSSLVLVTSFLTVPGFSFSTQPPTTASKDTVPDCLSWIVAQPGDDCELLAERSSIPLAKFRNYNPSLSKECSTTTGHSYCTANGLTTSNNEILRKDLTGYNYTNIRVNMGNLVYYLFLQKDKLVDNNIIVDWNRKVPTLFDSLSYADYSDWLQRSPRGQELQSTMDVHMLSEYLACTMGDINGMVHSWVLERPTEEEITCICYGSACCSENEVCPNLESKRLLRNPIGRDHESKIQPRADSYAWAEQRGGQQYSGTYVAIVWPRPSDFPFQSRIWQNVYAVDLRDDCTSLYLKTYTYSDIVRYVNSRNLPIDELDFAQVEHWVEKNIFAKFTADVIAERLPSGNVFRNANQVPPRFFSDFMNTNQLVLQTTPTVPGAQMETLPRNRIMHTLGTRAYTTNFMLLEAHLNNMKEGVSIDGLRIDEPLAIPNHLAEQTNNPQILKGDSPVSTNAIQWTMTNLPRVFVTYLRQIFGVIGYLNNADALDRGEATLRAIRWEWYTYQQEFNSRGNNVNVVAAWDEWYLDMMQTRMLAARDWLITQATDGLSHWQNNTHPDAQRYESIIGKYLDAADALEGFNSEGYPTGIPTAPP